MRLFITGFGPFEAIEDNPSAILARRLAAYVRTSFRVLKVSYEVVDEFLESDEADGFDGLLMLGFANRPTMTPEVKARNLNGPSPDVLGLSRPGPIVPNAPQELTSTLWAANTRLPLEMTFSEDAGGYLCNYLLYRALQIRKWPKAGFLHVPGFEVVSQEEQFRAIRKLIESVS